jgi:2,5-diketo-D-gluconate reductase B
MVAVADSAELAAIAAEIGATVVQIALAFLMHEGHIVTPSSGIPRRNAENFGAKDIVLSDADMSRLRAMEEGRRLVNGDWTPEWDV